MLYPASSKGYEPFYRRFAVGMDIKIGAGTTAIGKGQLVVTGERLLGVLTLGDADGRALDEASGSIYVFSIDLDDIVTTTNKANWRGKAVEAVFASTEEADPWFVLHVFVVAASVTNAGQAAPSSMPALLANLTPGGRKALQEAPET